MKKTLLLLTPPFEIAKDRPCIINNVDGTVFFDNILINGKANVTINAPEAYYIEMDEDAERIMTLIDMVNKINEQAEEKEAKQDIQIECLKTKLKKFMAFERWVNEKTYNQLNIDIYNQYLEDKDLTD